MKKIIVLLLLVVLTVFGCTSLGSIKDVSLVDPMGVVSVNAPAQITWYGEEEESGGFNLLGKLIDKAVEDSENEELSKLMSRTDFIIDEAAAILQKTLSSVDTVELITSDKVLSSTSYKKAKDNGMMDISDLITPDGYKFISMKDKAVFAELNKETGLKGNILAGFNFQRLMKNGIAKNGEMGAAVTMSITIIDENGEMLFTKSYYAQSQSSIGVIAGMYDLDKFVALYPETIKTVCEKFKAEFNQQ